MYDVIIIGAGVSGAAAARELSRYKGRICVLEKEEDVCCGTSKANSAIVHAGYDAPEGSLMAKLNVEGNRMMAELSRELDFPFRPCGSFVVCLDREMLPDLQALYERGVRNGVPGLEIITDKERIREMEPNLSDQTEAVLYAPTAGIVCPFLLNIAMAENACTNGVEFRFNTTVTGFTRTEEGWLVHTDKGDVETRTVVNAAGVYADELHNMVCEEKIHITPRRGDYCLLDKSAGAHVNRTIFALPGKYGKGVLVSPTVHGNLIVGPTAIDIGDKEATATTREGLDRGDRKGGDECEGSSHAAGDHLLCRSAEPMRTATNSSSGELPGAPGFVDCAGIESPGLTSSPAIGKMVAEIVEGILHLPENPDFNGVRKGILDPDTLSKEERAALIKENPAYGNIICRCEMVTEGEILDAIHRPLGARSLDGVKSRTRAGHGTVPGGLLYAQDHGAAPQRAWHSHDGDHKIRRGVQTPCGNQ